MTEPLENTYFNWLCSKVIRTEVPTPSLTRWNLLKLLHNTEFVWLLSGDDNRAEDGVELRTEFFHQSFIAREHSWDMLPCSVLEMMIAFARRADYQTEHGVDTWFWRFIENLHCTHISDAEWTEPLEHRYARFLEAFIFRTYRPDGDGGMFPLNDPDQDQRKVEIWYQFCAYLIDCDLL